MMNPLPTKSFTPKLFSATQPMLQQKMIEYSVFIAATPQAIWEYLVQPDLLPMWDKDVEDVALEWEQSCGENDVAGAVRRLYHPKGYCRKQIITDWKCHHILGYTTLTGLAQDGLEMHIGLFRLIPSTDGTEVQWLNYIEYTNPLTVHRMATRYRRHLNYLEWVVTQKNHSAMAAAF